jgi:hypothetical protein
MLAGNQRIGETDEPELLLNIVWGLIGTTRSDLGETNVLGLPVRQRKLETLTTPSLNGRR